MIRPILIIVLVVLFLISCVGPERLENSYNKIGSKCIANGKSMSSVEACLNLQFSESTYQDQIVKDHKSCKPYWGFPFMSSCGGIKIIYSQKQTVINWFAWGQLDGV
jgi:hypothetical protein